MPFWYCNQQWQPCVTVEDGDSFFHAAFGRNDSNLQACFDPLAGVRRMQWSAFLTYFENNPMPTCLEEQLQKCLVDNEKFVTNAHRFSEYAEDVMRKEHQIHIEELPVLATLQNIRIVLFVDDNEVPYVFEPNLDLLGNYPIENTSPLVEALVWLKESTFARLQADDSRIERPGTSLSTDTLGMSGPEPYKKYPTFIGGILYQLNLLALFLTNGIRKFPSWRLAADKEDAGRFDDVVFELLPSKETILVQARFKMAGRIISYRELFDSKYYLTRLYFSYQKIKHNYKVRNVVLCTNADLEDRLREVVNRERLEKDSIFHYEGVESWCYTFNDKIIPDFKKSLERSSMIPPREDDIISEESIQQFLNHFQIVALYPINDNLDTVIESLVFKLGYSHRLDSRDYSQHLNKKIIEWMDSKKGRYLTEVDAKAILCGYRSEQFCKKLHDIKIQFKADKLTFHSLGRMLHIVPQEEYTLNLIKVHRFLQESEVKSLFVNPDDPVYIQNETIEAFEASKYTYLVMCVNTRNEDVVEAVCKTLTTLLHKYFWKRVILIAGKDDKFVKRLTIGNENLYERLEDKISFTDLTEESQEKLFEEVIGIFEANL